jgi:RecA-family ATPase
VPAPLGEPELRSLIEPVARHFLGDPNPRLSTPKILRWGTNGSLAVDLEKGVFFDNEGKEGGGVVRLVEVQLPGDHDAAWRWLRQEYPNEVPKPKLNGGGSHFSATYPYTDADGTLLSQVLRKVPKAFVQRKPDPNDPSGWSWKLGGVKPVPYRLPELIEDIGMGRRIWICEGEKDVDRLRAAGLAATTNAGGAGKWKRELNQHFKGADVVVVADNDQAGRDHAAAVAAQLAGVAARVRVLDLGALWADCPPKGDVSDFLNTQGKSIADLEGLTEALPDAGESRALVVRSTAFTADILAPIPVPPRVWHVEGLVPAHTVTLLGGDGGVGKSTLALQLACATAAGLGWLGFMPRRGRALYVSCEDDRDELHRRLDRIALHYGLGLDSFADLKLWPLANEDAVLVLGEPGRPLEDTDRWGEFREMVDDWQPTLTIIDSLADVYGANENDRALVRAFNRKLGALAVAVAGSLIVLAHPSLAGLSSGSGLSGSTAWNNSVRSRLYLALPSSEDAAPAATDLRVLHVKKANYGPAGGDLMVRYQAGAFVLEGETTINALDRQIAADRVDALFLQLLARFTAQGRPVSHQPSSTYAPTLFAQDPSAHGVSMAAFRNAMNRLFAREAIEVELEGPPSKRRARLKEKAPRTGRRAEEDD